MTSRVLLHSTDQPESDTTAVVLSCNRPNLLDATLASFRATVGEPVRTVILDDSGEQEVFPLLVERYGMWADVVMFPQNRGQWHAFDFLVSYATTPFVFYVEDDWLFIRPGYLELSRGILRDFPYVGAVDIGDQRWSDYGATGDVTERFIWKKPWRISPTHRFWCTWTGAPALRRREDLLHLGRTAILGPEWVIDRKFHMMGLGGVFLPDVYVHHIGGGQSKAAVGRTPDHVLPCSQCRLDAVCQLPRIAWDEYDRLLVGQP